MASNNTRKTLAVFLATVVIASGFGAVSALAGVGGSAPAAVAQDDSGTETAETATETGTGMEASATFNAQKTDGWTVTVDRVVVPEGGFVTIHDGQLLNEGKVFESVLGTSVYLEPGVYEDLTVQLDERLSSGEVELVAMPHFDTNGNQQYDFVTSDGAEDGPYQANGNIVVDAATVTVDFACPPTDATKKPSPVDKPTETPTDNKTETPMDHKTKTPEGTQTPAGEKTTEMTETPMEDKTKTPEDTKTTTAAY